MSDFAIELRWVKTTKRRADYPLVVAEVGTLEGLKLQYRTGVNLPWMPDNPDDEWSKWQDVPIVGD